MAWWAAGVLWSYVIWFPVKLCVQFNLCVGAPPPVARLPGLPGCPLRELELGNTTQQTIS